MNNQELTLSIYRGEITELAPNQIFVFGSNEGSSTGGKPTHGKGAALIAKTKFGAVQGQSRGLQGQSYAIVTKKFWDVPKSSTLDEIHKEIQKLYEFAELNSHLQFLIAQRCENGLNSYSFEEIAKQFSKHERIPKNIVFEENFCKCVILTKHDLIKDV